MTPSDNVLAKIEKLRKLSVVDYRLALVRTEDQDILNYILLSAQQTDVYFIIGNPNLKAEHVRQIALESKSAICRTRAYSHPNLPTSMLDSLLGNIDAQTKGMKMSLLSNPSLPVEKMYEFFETGDSVYKQGLAYNPSCPEDLLVQVVKDIVESSENTSADAYANHAYQLEVDVSTGLVSPQLTANSLNELYEYGKSLSDRGRPLFSNTMFASIAGNRNVSEETVGNIMVNVNDPSVLIACMLNAKSPLHLVAKTLQDEPTRNQLFDNYEDFFLGRVRGGLVSYYGFTPDEAEQLPLSYALELLSEEKETV